MVSFDCPEKAVTDELISESFVQEQKYLRFRNLILRSLVAAVAITDDVRPSKSNSISNGDSGGGGGGEQMTKAVEEIAAKIEETAESCGDVNLDEDWLNPLQGPERPKLHGFLKDRDDAIQRNSFCSALTLDFLFWESAVSKTADVLNREDWAPLPSRVSLILPSAATAADCTSGTSTTHCPHQPGCCSLYTTTGYLDPDIFRRYICRYLHKRLHASRKEDNQRY